MYFLMIRPQMKRAKEHRAMLGALAEEPPETRARLRGLIRELRVVTVRR